MASISLISAVTIASSSKTTLLSPMTQRATKRPKGMGLGLKVRATMKEKAVSGLTAGAVVTASLMVADVAEAAELVPSLNNFLFSILAGGAVLTAIFGAVIAVSNFDPVKRV